MPDLTGAIGQPPRFGVYCAATALTVPATMALAGAVSGQSSRLGGYGGLFQRASIITGFAWLTAVSARSAAPPNIPICAPKPGSTQGIATTQIGGSFAASPSWDNPQCVSLVLPRRLDSHKVRACGTC